MFCFCVLSRKKDSVSVEVEMLNLDFGKLTNPATQLINGLKHELVVVIVNSVEELLEFIHCQIPYDFAKPLVFSGRFAGYGIGIAIYPTKPNTRFKFRKRVPKDFWF